MRAPRAALVVLGLIVLAALPAHAASQADNADPIMLIQEDDTLNLMGQSAAAKAAGFVFTTATPGMNPETLTLAGDTIEAQTEQALDNIEAALRAAGGGLENIVHVRMHVANLDDYRTANAIYLERMNGHAPPRSVIGFTPWDPRFRLQLEVIAYIPEEPDQ